MKISGFHFVPSQAAYIHSISFGPGKMVILYGKPKIKNHVQAIIFFPVTFVFADHTGLANGQAGCPAGPVFLLFFFGRPGRAWAGPDPAAGAVLFGRGVEGDRCPL
jgi:hypothetical protein